MGLCLQIRLYSVLLRSQLMQVPLVPSFHPLFILKKFLVLSISGLFSVIYYIGKFDITTYTPTNNTMFQSVIKSSNNDFQRVHLAFYINGTLIIQTIIMPIIKQRKRIIMSTSLQDFVRVTPLYQNCKKLQRSSLLICSLESTGQI